MTFAGKLIALREAKGWTQQQLADAASASVWTLRGYEQGRRQPDWRAFLDLTLALGAPAETFAECSADEKPIPRPRGNPRLRRPQPPTETSR